MIMDIRNLRKNSSNITLTLYERRGVWNHRELFDQQLIRFNNKETIKKRNTVPLRGESICEKNDRA